MTIFARFRRPPAQPAPAAEPPKRPDYGAAYERSALDTARWHAFRSLQLDVSGDPEEARHHLGDAGEYLAHVGGPRWPKTAEEVYQWCAAREAREV